MKRVTFAGETKFILINILFDNTVLVDVQSFQKVAISDPALVSYF